MSEIGSTTGGVIDTIKELSMTPYPPLLFTTSLFLTPLLNTPNAAAPVPQQQLVSQDLIKRLSPFGRGKVTIRSLYPSTISCLVFGSAVGLGGFMINDHDLINGSGVVSAWSILYTIVNFKNSMWRLTLWPKLLIGLSLFNSYMYGRTFILGGKNKNI